MAVAVEPRALAQSIDMVPLDLIDPAPDNPRRDVGDVDELAQSIRSIGLLEPLVVTPRGDRYLLVCGARRYAAALLAGETAVPSVIRVMNEMERILAMAIENLQRVDLSPIEEGRAYRQLIDDVGLKQRELATRVGRSQGHISKRLSLLELPAKVVDQLDSGGITVAIGLELAKLAEHPDRIEAVLADQTVDGRIADTDEFAWQIENELGAIEKEQKAAAARAELAAAGVRILEIPTHHPYRPAGAIEISKGGGYDNLKLDPEKHSTEPCHAAGIDQWGHVHFYCTDRKRHPKLKTQSESSRSSTRLSSTQTAQKEKEKKIAAATKQRREFITGTLVKKRIPAATLTATVLEALITASHQEALKLACRFVELEPPKTKRNGAFYASTDYAGALRTYAAAGEKQRNAVLVALVAGTHEEFLTSPWMSDDAFSRRGEYFEILEANGYVPDTFEQQRLGRKKRTTRKAA